MHLRFQNCFAFFVALAILMAAVGCKRDPAPEPSNTDGPFTTEKTPDGQSLVVTFPGKPEWTDVPDVTPQTKGFVWRGEGKLQYAAWVWTIPAEELRKRTSHELGSDYAVKAGYNSNIAYFFYGQDPRGAGTGGWYSKPDPDDTPRVPPVEPLGAGTVLIVGNKAYYVRITGVHLSVKDPEFKTFFDSLKPEELVNRPAAASAPEDDLRPLARDGVFTNQAAVGTHTNGAAICPGRQAAFRATLTYGRDFADSKASLKRYKYPTFEPDGEYKVPGFTHLLGYDDRSPRRAMHRRNWRGSTSRTHPEQGSRKS
jgi:hypothetical protein